MRVLEGNATGPQRRRHRGTDASSVTRPSGTTGALRSRMRALVFAVALVAAGVAPTHAQAIPAHRSFDQLAWSNGFAAGFFDLAARRAKGFRDHLFAQVDASTGAHELMYDAYLGVRVGGQNAWLTTRPIDRAGYDGDTGLAQIVQHQGDVQVTQTWFAPYAVAAPVEIVVVDVTNTGTAALADSALFSIENLKLGGGADGSLAESITWQANEYAEAGARGVAVHRALPAPTAHACSPANPYDAVIGGGHLANTDSSGTRDDAVAGFEWNLTGLAPGAHKLVAIVLGFRGDGDRAALDTALAALPADPGALLDQARTDWAAFQGRATEPPGLSTDERAVYRRQLTILRMGQVREPGGGHGQIIASMPPGRWNIAWVRDQAYATRALIRAGLTDEAKDALGFWLGAGAGGWVCCDRDGGPWVGAAYGVSVVRYRGDGSEESDQDAHGPNIEFDGFGLALIALDEYVAATGDLALVTDHADRVFGKLADVLVGLVEPSGATAGLIRADSSIWESHWYDGGRKHFAYTQATSVRGLRAAAALATRAGRAADASRYSAAADQLAAAVAAHFLDPASGAARGNLEEAQALDAAAIELFNWDVLDARGPAAVATLAAFDAGLWNGLVGHGYRRNDDGGDYDLREWIVVDLRVAHALERLGRTAAAAQLVAWVTAQARANFDLVPENFDRTTGDFSGETPMVGFGAGAYVMALWDRGAAPASDGAPLAPDAAAGSPDAGGATPPPDTGCCGAAASQPGMAGLVGLAVLRRRRRRA
jgi:GH15 family glucan-1,4-alpha-glucosidase